MAWTEREPFFPLSTLDMEAKKFVEIADAFARVLIRFSSKTTIIVCFYEKKYIVIGVKYNKIKKSYVIQVLAKRTEKIWENVLKNKTKC